MSLNHRISRNALLFLVIYCHFSLAYWSIIHATTLEQSLKLCMVTKDAELINIAVL